MLSPSQTTIERYHSDMKSTRPAIGGQLGEFQDEIDVLHNRLVAVRDKLDSLNGQEYVAAKGIELPEGRIPQLRALIVMCMEVIGEVQGRVEAL